MKSILTIILAAIMLLSMLGGCAKDMSGETRPSPTAAATTRPTATGKPTPTAKATPASTDSSADGIIDEGRDAVDGVVGAGEDAVDDIMDAGEDMLDDVTGRNQTNTSGNGTNNGDGGSRPAATPRSTGSD